MKIVYARGSAREIGRQTGEALREEIRQHLEIVRRHPLPANWSQRLPVFLAASQRHTPLVLAEMQGTAEGANLPEADIYRLNFPLYANDLSAGEGCTNIAFATGPDGPVWGKNNDGIAAQPRLPVCCRVVNRTGSLPLVVFTFCGLIATLDGMNAAGLAVGHSSVGSIFQQSDHHVGIRHWGYEGLLGCHTTAEFVRHMSALPCRDKGYSILCVDREGVTASLEAPVPLVQVRRPTTEPGHLNCVNCYQLPTLAEADRRDPAGKANALARAAFLEQWVATSTDFSAAAMQRLLASHEAPALCRHGVHEPSLTEYAMIGLPQRGEVRFRHGLACGGDYETLQI
jgi:hypothetical protein